MNRLEIFVLAGMFLAGFAKAASVCPNPLPANIQCVANGASQNINTSALGLSPSCETVNNQNPSGDALFVPIHSQSEWSGFVSHPPSGVTLTSCSGKTPPPACTSGQVKNCIISASGAGTCGNGTVGICSFSCSGGNWLQLTYTCAAAPKYCSSATLGSTCSLPGTPSGTVGVPGTCVAGTTGSCSYTCDSSGTWVAIRNTCATPSGASCAPATIPNGSEKCKLSKAANNGQTENGTCITCVMAVFANCTYTCTNGVWTQ